MGSSQSKSTQATGGNNATADVEGKKEVYDKRLHGNVFVRFITGPYFDVIPVQYERATKERKAAIERGEEVAENEGPGAEHKDYMTQLRHLAMNEVDTDGVYGLNPDELVPLPFDVPLWPMYVVEILAGVFTVAQATIVMFIAIYVENTERAWKSGDRYTRVWQPMIRALIIVYPLATLIFLVNFTVECCVKKFMYFRLLSMRILVDWANRQMWETLFFYYFLGTWGVMNAWAIWGLKEYYGRLGNTGVDPTSFGTFVIVNLQTVQLLIYYYKLLSSETRLVSLNQLFERAPVEAQHLLEYTYVIEEEDLVQECYDFSKATQKARLHRIANMFTCGLTGKEWHGSKDGDIYFNIQRLKERAANFKEVNEKIKRLRESMAPPAKEVKQEEKQPVISEITPASPGGEAVRTVEDVTVTVRVNSTSPANQNGTAPVHDTLPSAAPSSSPAAADSAPAKKFRFGIVRWFYARMYASLYSFTISTMRHFDSWPFRPDIKYFRMLSFIQFLGIFAVGAIVVMGWLYSARNSSCAKSAKTCNTCLAVHERYFGSEEPICTAVEKAITRIVASTQGTWLNNGVREERYCNFDCTGTFAVTDTCPPVTN